MSQEKPKASFVTFYSFKGGVGRSMALINTAGILAGRGFRVLVIDLDLEAPGLSYLNPGAPDASPTDETPKKRSLQLGFVDLLSDAKERGQEADLFALSAHKLAERYTQTYNLPEELREFKDGSLHIMPAGKFDDSYAQRFDALNLRQLYQEGLGEPLIRAFKKKLADADLYDYVLVDSRTGFSDEAGICTRDLADHLMILSGLNRQNVEGTCEFLKALRVATDGKKPFQIILSPVPNGEDALVDQREKIAKLSFEEAWGSEIKIELQIPYHPQLALTEEPHIFRRRRGYLFEAYRAIERRMLRALGHDARALMRGIEESIQQQDYPAVLRDLRHMVRLDGGRSALYELAYDLGRDNLRSPRGKAEGEATQKKPTLDKILSDEDGRRVVEFIVDHLPLGEREWGAQSLLAWLVVNCLDLAERLHKRIVDSAPTDAKTLIAYADFLAEKRDDKDGAELYHKRAIEAEPKDADNLASYAYFLADQRDDKDGAEVYYKRAIEADPKSASILGSYALFLADQRGDKDGAEAYHKRAIEADPKSASILGNYGQFLVGNARVSEGEKELLSAFEHHDRSSLGNVVEVYFSLWLVSRMQGHDAERWERGFKFLIQQGFTRHRWSFERMLDQAEKTLSPEEFEYAKALAAAFLDESKVADLERYERWRALEPLDPKPDPRTSAP
nr:AAA family ATPase [Rhodoferax sp.]